MPIARKLQSFASLRLRTLDRWLVAVALLGMVGVLLVVFFGERGVPVAKIDFRVLQPGAEAAARMYLAQHDIDLSGYRTAVSFATDTDAQGYIERTAGQTRLNEIASTEVTIWHWQVRFFRELDPLEYSVSVLPDGRIAGWNRTLAEAAPGANLDEDQARQLAVQSLQNTGVALDGWSTAGVSKDARPNRTDYLFTWERDGWKVGDATHRRAVLIQGDQFGGYYDYLRVPEVWVRDMRYETNRGIVLANAGWTLTYGIGLAAIVVFLLEWRARRTFRWLPISFGVAFTAVGLAALLNQLPLWVAGTPTTSTVASYLIAQAISQVSQLLPELLSVALASAAGLAIWSRAFPDIPNPGSDFRRSALTSRRFVTAVLFGYFAAGAWLGYFTLYYWIGTALFGVWSPVELPYQDVLSGAFPAGFPLFVGGGAAIGEETLFRLFAIPAGYLAVAWIWQRLTKAPLTGRPRIVLLGAVIVIAAVIWGSLHSTYPQQPFFIRALEVSIIGVFAGVVLLRWGLVATMATHFIGNASIVGALFFLSGNASLQISAALVIALPLLLLVPAAVRIARRLPLLDVPPAEPIPPALSLVKSGTNQVVQRLVPIFELPRGRLPWMVVATMALAALALVLRIPRPSDAIHLDIDRNEAVQSADAFASQLGIPTEGYLALPSVLAATGSAEATYLVRHAGADTATEFYRSVLPAAYWQVHYVRPLDKNELYVQIGPDGQRLGFTRLVDDAAPGASPSIDDAREQAVAWLHAFSGTDDWGLISESQTKRPNRVDSSFVWERPNVSYGEATVRAQVTMIGSEPGGYTEFLKIPEAFVRDLNRTTGLESALQLTRDMLTVLVAIIAAAIYLRAFRQRQTEFRQAIRLGATATGAWLVLQLCSIPNLLAAFPNTLDFAGFAVYRLSLMLRQGAVTIVIVIVLASALPFLWRQHVSRLTDLETPTQTQRVWLAFTGAISVLALGTLAWSLRAAVAPLTLWPTLSAPPLNALVPAFSSLATGTLTALQTGLGLALALLLLERWVPVWFRYPLVAAIGALMLASMAVGPADVLTSAAFGAVAGVLVLAYSQVCAADSWTISLMVGLTVVTRDALGLLLDGRGQLFYFLNGISLVLAMIVLLLWASWPRNAPLDEPAKQTS